MSPNLQPQAPDATPEPRASRRYRSWLIGMVALITVALATPATVAAAHPPTRPAGPRPTIVLVHGAWADASSWSRVTHLLQGEGYTVDAPPNPLRGLAEDSTYLANYLATISGPIILVGHSYGGAVITDAATGNPNIRALVYVDAFAPDLGESIGLLAATQPGSVLLGNPADVFNAVPYPGAPADDPDLYLKTSVYEQSFAQDLPTRESAALAAGQRPLAQRTIGDASTAPAWKSIPSWYVVGTQDEVIPPAEQEFMAQRMGAQITTVSASHLAMVSHPVQVEQVILTAARAEG